MTFLIAGSLGFIGLAAMRWLLTTIDEVMVNADSMIYATSLGSLGTRLRHLRHVHVPGDIRAMRAVLAAAHLAGRRLRHEAAPCHSGSED